MSIATTATIHPSRCLQCLLLMMAVLLLAVAVQLMRMPAAGTRLVIHQLLSVVCVAAVVQLFFAVRRLAKVFVIDISGTGVIRFHHTGRVAADALICVSDHQHSDEVVQSLRDSTLWSSMLLLRLRSAHGRVFVVPVLPDSMSAASFRSLSIACRWIATQNPSPSVHGQR